MLDTTEISPDGKYELILDAGEFSIFSLAMTILHGMMTKNPGAAYHDMTEAMLLMIQSGNSPQDITNAVNSLGAKIDLIAEHHKKLSGQ